MSRALRRSGRIKERKAVVDERRRKEERAREERRRAAIRAKRARKISDSSSLTSTALLPANKHRRLHGTSAVDYVPQSPNPIGILHMLSIVHGGNGTSLPTSMFSSGGRGGGGERACAFCGKEFATAKAFRAHIRSHTGSQHTGECPYVCEFCGKSFGQNNNLLAHAHRRAAVYTCGECSRRLATRAT